MIQIKSSPTADSRTAEFGTVSKEELLQASIQHIGDVQKAMAYFIGRLATVAAIHDHTKISGIDKFYEAFEQGLTGKAFKSCEWYQDHLNERHHLTERCPADVNLIDIMERICDIVTAGMARTGSVYDDSLSPEILELAYKNTIVLLKNNIEIVKENR